MHLGEPHKSPGKGDEPHKSERKGGGAGGDGATSGCGNEAALNILRSAADLCGLLVVAVVSPMGGGRTSTCTNAGSPQRLALSEVRRKAELRDREAQNGPGPSAPPHEH